MILRLSRGVPLAIISCLFLTCTEDSSTADQIDIEQRKEVEYLRGKPYSSKKVSLKEIPQVKDFLFSKSGGNLFSGGKIISKGSGEIIMNEDEVMMIVDTLGRENYSFQFLHTEAPPYTFYNLIVPKAIDGSTEEPYVVSYTSDSETVDEFLNGSDEGGIDFSDFTGTMDVHPFEHYFSEGDYFKSSCSGHDEFGDPILCEQLFLDNGANSSGGGTDGGDYGGAPPNGSPTAHTGWSGITIYHITPAANNNRVYRFGSGSECEWEGQCVIVHVYDSGDSASNKGVTDDCEGCEVFALAE